MNPRIVKIYRIHYEGRDYTGNVRDLSEYLKLSVTTINNFIQGISAKEEAEYLGKNHPIYELVEVKTQNVLQVGTLEEITKTLGIKENSIWGSTRYFLYFTGNYKFVEANDTDEEERNTKEPIENIIEQIGRMKYLNRINAKDKFYLKWTPTALHLKRLKEAGIELEDVAEVKVKAGEGK